MALSEHPWTHVAALVPFFEKLHALTEDTASEGYAFGDITFVHSDGWHVAVARFEDAQWWLDFSRYGQDLSDGNSTPSARPEGSE